MKSNSKINYVQAIEAYYSSMSDAEFIQKFEEMHEKDLDNKYTIMLPKYLPFFKANLDEDTYWNLYDELETGTADIQPFLDEHPELIALLPIHELWSMQADERLQLLIHHPEEADILKQTLEGNDIWAISLPMLTPAIQKKAAALCPWDTLTVSQKRYMALKSTTLKKIISEL